MEHQGSIVSFILFLLPGFPKDSLCYSMGLEPYKNQPFSRHFNGREAAGDDYAVRGRQLLTESNKVLAVRAVAVALAFCYREQWLAMLREKKHHVHAEK